MEAPRPSNTGSRPEQEDQALTLADLHDRLDSLWTKYLQYLDVYTQCQTLLQSQLSGGFIDLARGNFNAPSGRRYGKDCFHERAVATRRVTVTSESNGPARFEILRRNIPSNKDSGAGDAAKGSTDEDESKDPQQQPSPPATPAPEDEDATTSEQTHEPKTPATDSSLSLSASSHAKDTNSMIGPKMDPLRWFGILVPRELRTAQAKFSLAVDETVAQAANAMRSMRDTELEVRKLRKEIRRTEKGAAG